MTRLTIFSKILIVLAIVGVAAGAAWKLGAFNGFTGKISTGTASNGGNPTASSGTTAPKPSSSKDSGATSASNNGKYKMKISLDEWIGWESLLDANGGLKTAKGSIYDRLGLDLELAVINDATQSSSAIIAGELDGGGYTVNRYAFIYPKFVNAKVPVKMAFITNSSTGGDGIISKKEINGVEGLVGKSIAVPRFSEAQTLVEWLMETSDLTPDQIQQIRSKMVLTDTPDDAAKAFFSGQVDAAATWEPYLTQASNTVGAKIFFSTKSATNLILDGIVFREDYLKKNPEAVAKFIEGALEAQSMYPTELKYIKDFPLFSTFSDDDIMETKATATLSNFTSNKELLGGLAQSLYKDMCKIWSGLGETVLLDQADNAFDSTILLSLSDKYTTEEKQVIKITPVEKEKAQAMDNTQALLKKTLTINFEPNVAILKEDSYEALIDFANTAKILNGAVIQIEGNIADTGEGDNESGRKLSLERAKTVAQYIQMQGVDPSRFVVIGNGITKPIGDNATEEGKKRNRRTDIYFKIIE